MKPKISTSFRPHGKWGDFLAAIVPILWCMNILANSNFILRLIEWQSETNLFTIRIRARQWYWVYKIDLKNFFSVLNINKNIGRNKWYQSNLIDNNSSLKNISILNNKIYNKSILLHWNELNLKYNNIKKTNFLINIENKNNIVKNVKNFTNINSYFSSLKNKYKNTQNTVNNDLFLREKNIYFLKYKRESFFNLKINQSNLNFFDFSDNSRFLKINFGQKLPFRLTKFNLSLSQNSLFNIKFNNEESLLRNRDLFNTNYLVIKQKKYTKKNNLVNFTKNNLKKSVFLFNNKIFLEAKEELLNYYKLIKKNKNHSDLIASTLNKRLLRTKKTLTIPAHINLSLITSSFDIVHSWFIPGLGLKLDCVPGRSTHHSFYIDNVGFYYGQCAEICGRYHHHMPIRICALPFEHFLIWWQNFGLIKLCNYNLKKKDSTIFFFRKFCW